jgi:hypothetical protein
VAVDTIRPSTNKPETAATEEFATSGDEVVSTAKDVVNFTEVLMFSLSVVGNFPSYCKQIVLFSSFHDDR